MKTDTQILYNHFIVYLNKWGEYCVCRKMTGRMVAWNSGFLTLQKAKAFIDKINPVELPQKDIEEIAEQMQGRGNRGASNYVVKG